MSARISATATSDLRLPLYPIEQSTPKQTFLVTGGNGYIASEIIFRLLSSPAQHIVHASVRGDTLSDRYAPLLSLPDAATRLKLFSADLTTPNAFDEAIIGVDHVIHVAQPVSLQIPPSKVQELQIKPAVEGIQNIVSAINTAAAAKAAGSTTSSTTRTAVKTLVLSSSLSAVFADNYERGPDHVYTEDDWTIGASESFLPYSLSKTLAEKKAWELYHAQKEDGQHSRWRLVVLNPSFGLGPARIPCSSELIQFAVDAMNAKVPVIPHYQLGMVDLADVAAAHILAALDPSIPVGRYILFEGETSRSVLDVVRLLKEDRLKKYPLPTRSAPKFLLWIASIFQPDKVPWDLVKATLNKKVRADGQKVVREFKGFAYSDPVKGMGDMMMSVVELGLAPRR